MEDNPDDTQDDDTNAGRHTQSEDDTTAAGPLTLSHEDVSLSGDESFTLSVRSGSGTAYTSKGSIHCLRQRLRRGYGL